jgi:3-mercaptopyruvate sulfurtransferase SseA
MMDLVVDRRASMRMWSGTLAILLAGAPPLLAGQAGTPAAPPAAAPAASDAGNVVIQRVTVDELKKLMASDKVLVLDVRAADAYKESHIPGSISVPLAEIDTHVEKLKSAKKDIVTYCT